MPSFYTNVVVFSQEAMAPTSVSVGMQLFSVVFVCRSLSLLSQSLFFSHADVCGFSCYIFSYVIFPF